MPFFSTCAQTCRWQAQRTLGHTRHHIREHTTARLCECCSTSAKELNSPWQSQKGTKHAPCAARTYCLNHCLVLRPVLNQGLHPSPLAHQQSRCCDKVQLRQSAWRMKQGMRTRRQFCLAVASQALLNDGTLLPPSKGQSMVVAL